MIRKVIVFGATGMVGRELVFELIEDQEIEHILAIVRRPLNLSDPKLEQRIVPDLNRAFTEFPPDAYQACFCCIGTTLKKAGSKDVFTAVDRDLPVAIARWTENQRIPNLVVISSVSADPASGNFYLKTKGEMEGMVQSVYHGNLKFIRPSLIMGHRDEFRAGEKIASLLMNVLKYLLIGPLSKYKGLYSWEIARAMLGSAQLPDSLHILEGPSLIRLAQVKKKSKSDPKPGMI